MVQPLLQPCCAFCRPLVAVLPSFGCVKRTKPSNELAAGKTLAKQAKTDSYAALGQHRCKARGYRAQELPAAVSSLFSACYAQR